MNMIELKLNMFENKFEIFKLSIIFILYTYYTFLIDFLQPELKCGGRGMAIKRLEQSLRNKPIRDLNPIMVSMKTCVYTY